MSCAETWTEPGGLWEGEGRIRWVAGKQIASSGFSAARTDFSSKSGNEDLFVKSPLFLMLPTIAKKYLCNIVQA